MFKKLLFTLIVVLFASVSYAQTIVSTSPQDQNVVLEEFTGIHCVFCPQGHAIAKAIQDANPDRVSLINIHQGSFSNPGPGEPDFRTPYGNAIVAQSYSGSGFGYPSGTVNRHVFPGRSMASGGGTAMGRNFWTISANETLAKPSPVNVAVEAEIDVVTNVLTVHVEAYYTSNSPEATNMLNVALLQNNTKGPQIGGNSCDQYVHMHRLVEMITGQWGEEITTTTAGTFVDKTYTYPIPADYNGVPVELADLEIVAFMAETHQEIASGNRAYPTFTNFANANDANVRYIADFEDPCANYLAPQVNIQNTGQNPITSLAIEYSINGGAPATYTWNGNLTSMHYQTVDLPGIRFDIQANNTLTITVANDDDNSNNTATATFDKAYDATTTVNMELHTDQYGSECRWNVTDYDGNIIYSGGPYGANQTINETFTLPSNCYTFNIIDTYGDGGGPVTLTDTDPSNTVFYQTNGVFGCGDSVKFSTDGFVLGVAQTQLEDVVLYPNPASTTINLSNAENANIQVFDILGKLILSQENIPMDAQINVSQLQAGTYFMKISKDNLVTTKRFLISR
ncbi:T9SS type A sorting domain-containing protein [Aequorivita todarodis]|uniref:T9SS type A sorting domain-containing protein n=1 Tax=Aequorivita todarodis TaxID=2036821 RepID=UPI00234FF0C9|nr:T9SS type A sorting domain-containing protein [Aequorivita todarodis]MDC8000788.1 T9SS type A sorting domain-containing protein [Aequorivita todarodis]